MGPRDCHRFVLLVFAPALALALLSAVPVAAEPPRPLRPGDVTFPGYLVPSYFDASQAVLGPVSLLSGVGLIQLGANPFDLEGRTVRFTPTGDGRYAVQALPLDFDFDQGQQLKYIDALGAWYAYGWSVQLGFAFSFGGQSWRSVFVNNNGNVSFGQPEAAFWPQRDPWSDGTMRSVAAVVDSRAAAGRERLIAALWANYDSWGSNAVYARATADRLIVTWNIRRNPSTYTPLGMNVFQARLFASGVIELAYQQVPERDGFVGVFPGSPVNGALLDHVDDAGDAPDSVVDIVAADIHNSGSVIRFTMTMGAEIPAAVSSGALDYRVFLSFTGTDCSFGLSVTDAQRGTSTCNPAPATIGFRTEGTLLHFYFSKSILRGTGRFSWAMDVVWWGFPGRFDQIAFDSMRSVALSSSGTARVDLSTAEGVYPGNIFEVFHYAAFPKPIEDTLRIVYQSYPPDDDFAVVFTDFRVDDLFATGPGTGPINVPISGIGPWMANPRPGSVFGSGKLQVSMSPLYVGAPLFAESLVVDGLPTHGHSRAIGLIAHETVHRWGIQVRSRNPLTGGIVDLTDDSCHCHWSDYLHAPSLVHVSQNYTATPYPESSPMGGNVWVQNLDGTFTREPKPYGQPMGLSALDLYLMGLLAPQEVPDTFILTGITDLGNGRVNATQVPVRITDVIAVMGPRVPASDVSQREFRLGVYLIYDPTRGAPDPGLLARAQGISGALPTYFSAATGGRMRVLNPGDLYLSATVNQASFSVGETLAATVGVSTSGLPGAADFYLGFLRPDGVVECFANTGDIALGTVTDLASFVPVAIGVSLASPFQVMAPNFFSRQWTGNEPHGPWVFFLLAVRAGAFANGVVTAGDVLGLATAPFSFP